jgi:hypothetical protein
MSPKCVTIPLIKAGTIQVHDYMADFWKKVFTDLTVHDTVRVRTGASLGVAIRKNSPLLAAQLNEFLAQNGLGTALGNVIEKRYLVSTKFATRATSEAERRKFLTLVEFFKKYGDKYQVDYLLMAAQGYQESKLDQSVKSRVGAVGVMQVMPATGKELKVRPSARPANIHAGVKYMRFRWTGTTRTSHGQAEQACSRCLLQRGPAGCASCGRRRRRASTPTSGSATWSRSHPSASGGETVTYVSNICKYYVAYRLIARRRAPRGEKGPQGGRISPKDRRLPRRFGAPSGRGRSAVSSSARWISGRLLLLPPVRRPRIRLDTSTASLGPRETLSSASRRAASMAGARVCHHSAASRCVQAGPVHASSSAARRPPPAGRSSGNLERQRMTSRSRDGVTGRPSRSDGGFGVECRWWPMISTPDFPLNTSWPVRSA